MNTALRAAVRVLIVAVVGLGVALFLVASSLSADVDDAEQAAARAEEQAQEVADLKPVPEVTQNEMDMLEDTLTTQVEGVQSRLAKRIKRIEDCVPEVQAQIDSLDIEAGPYITTNQQVSRVCVNVVYGPPPTGD